jgi:hypoxanthine phosphoribosyltransferase
MDKSVAQLIPSSAIKKVIQGLGTTISFDYKDKDLTVVCLLDGSLVFTANLLLQIKIPVNLFSIKVSSYIGKQSSGNVYCQPIDLGFCKDKNVLLIDDILDSGLTLSTMMHNIFLAGAKDVRTCVLLNKQVERTEEINIIPNYKAFDIQNEFVVGYGMDYNGLYRNLPYIGVLQDK